MQNKLPLLSILILLIIISQVASVQGASSAYLNTVPSYLQEEAAWCGPAALQMVLQFWGINMSQSDIAKQVYDETGKLSNISTIVDFTRRLGFQNIPLVSSINQLKVFVDEGLPAIVLQKISESDARGHYRVVIGYDDSTEVFITHDPQRPQNYYIPYSEFANLWKDGSTFTGVNWTLVLAPSYPYSVPEPTIAPTPAPTPIPTVMETPAQVPTSISSPFPNIVSIWENNIILYFIGGSLIAFVILLFWFVSKKS